jgi:DNA-binding HxlR family transcriptional regulator
VRPGELARSIPQATRRVLTAQLAELVRHVLISKSVYDENVPRVEYHLTDLGMSLMNVVDVMGKWGTENLNELRKLVNSY